MKLIGAALALLITGTVMGMVARPVDPADSRVVATFKQMNVPVEGSFGRFTGSVSHDPANPATSSAELTIDTTSFDIGDEEYNAEVRKSEWFDSKAHPQAHFKSTSVRALAADRFEAEGQLTLKGRTQTVKAQVKVKQDATGQRFEGELPLSRKAFGIGDPDWDEVLEDRVTVKFVIVTPA